MLTPLLPRKAYPRRTWQRQARREVASEQLDFTLRDMAPANCQDEAGNYTNGYDEEQVAGFFHVLSLAREPYRASRLHNAVWKAVRLRRELWPALRLAVLRDDKAALKGLLAEINRARLRAALTRAQALKHLEREAFRLFLSRRVPSVPRRARTPRPLYARPIPPTAPLAPPVS